METVVKYEPRKEVIIHEYTSYESAEDLINATATGVPPGSFLTALRWVNGVLLSSSALPINEVTTKELINGRLHWDHVSFASMPEYQERITAGAGVTVLIRNVSNNPVFARIAEFIKKEFLKTR
jgi:hypothetical protein